MSLRALLRGDLLKFAGPLVLTGLSQTIMSSVDYIFTKHLDDHVAAAIAPASMLYYTPLSLLLGVISIYSTKLGAVDTNDVASDKEAIQLKASFSFLLLAAILLSAMTYLSSNYLVGLLGHQPDIKAFELDYFRSLVWAAPLACTAFYLQNLFAAAGDTRTPSVCIISGHFINVSLNYVFVEGLFTEPMGLGGAALATVMASGFQAFSMLLLANRRRLIAVGYYQNIRNSFIGFKRILKSGLPVGIQWCQSTFVWLIFTSYIIAPLGDVELASHNVLNQVAKIAGLPLIGLANAAATLIARYRGQGDEVEAVAIGRSLLAYNVVYITLLGIMFDGYLGQFLSLYSESTQVISYCINLLPVLIMYTLLFGCEAAVAATLRGYDDTLKTASVNILCSWGLIICGGYGVSQMYPHLGLVGPWIGILASVFIVFLTLYVRLKRTVLPRSNYAFIS